MNKNLLSKTLTLGIVVLFIGVGITPAIALNIKKSSSNEPTVEETTIAPFSRGKILYVGGSEGGNYTTIQDAIDNASDGDTVFVFDDSAPYYENIIVDISISLIGENNETTVIDAQKDGTPIRIVADGCLVSGFTIFNCEGQINQNWGDAVIKIDEGSDVIIRDNILDAGEVQTSGYANYGTIELKGCTNCKIINNYVVQNTPDSYTMGIGLHDNSSNNIISENDISHYNFGIRVTGYGINRDNIISENHLHHNRFGVAIGNVYNEILNNLIEFNTEVGINIQNGCNNIISFNIVQYNGEGEKYNCGIELMGYTPNNNNIVSDNIISNNNPCGLQTEYSHGNIITRNNFLDNYGKSGNPERWWGNAYFHFQDGFFYKDSFKNNYWSGSIFPGLFPKIIFGILEIMRTAFTIPWFNIDWRPAKEPYDIP